MHSCMDFHAIELLFTREDFSSADWLTFHKAHRAYHTDSTQIRAYAGQTGTLFPPQRRRCPITLEKDGKQKKCSQTHRQREL
jgi:hypothetical protein